jgi:hypothetical protein
MPRKAASAPRARSRARADSPAPKAPTKSSAAAPSRIAPSAQGVLQGPLQMATVWSQFAQQMQRAGEQTLQGWARDAEAHTVDAAHAKTPQQWIGLPLEAMAEQSARWLQLSTQVTASLLDVQSAWFRDVEAATAQWMTPWVARDGRAVIASAQKLVEPPSEAGPAQVWQSAQRIWSESAKVWLNAMSHDLQREPAARAA